MHTLKTSKAREKILSKIRNGLNNAKLPMPFPEIEAEQDATVYSGKGLSPEEAFADEFIKLGGKFIFCESEHDLVDGVHALYDSRGWREVLCTEPKILEHFHNNKVEFVKEADPSNGTADACITGCEALIGRTGSVLLSSRQNFGRTAPVYYPVHIIVAYADQVVADIKDSLDLLKKKYGSEVPSMINLNTGPSRTADIEKTLVVGVHGPGEVFCFFINA